MPYPLFIGQDAQEDIVEAWLYFESQRTGLGDMFVDELGLSFDRIGDKPLSFPLVYTQKRRAILRKFRFNAFFTFDGSEVHLLAVMHGSRDPKRWQKR
jgi:toxin ParE1/3/4